MKTKLLPVFLLALVSIVGVPSALLAAECPDRDETTLETNAEFFERGRKLAAEALEHAKQGHAEQTKVSANAALDALSCIVASRAGSQLQSPRAKLRTGANMARKGDLDKAVKYLEEGVAELDKVDLSN